MSNQAAFSTCSTLLPRRHIPRRDQTQRATGCASRTRWIPSYGQVPSKITTAGRSRAIASQTRSVNNSCQRRDDSPVAPADGTYSNGNPNWPTTPTAWDSDRKCGAKSG